MRTILQGSDPFNIATTPPNVVTASYGEGIVRGHVVYAVDGGVAKARANTFATSVPIGLADGEGGVITAGPITLDDWTAVAGTLSLEPGKVYFLSVDNAGMITLSTSEVSGTYVVIMGVAVNENTFKIDIHRALVNA